MTELQSRTNIILGFISGSLICITISLVFVSQLSLLGATSTFFTILAVPLGIIFAVVLFTVLAKEINKLK